MTTKLFKALSPPDKCIEIIADSGIAGTINVNPCRYEIESADEKVNICIVLSQAGGMDDDDDDDIEADIDMILFIKR